jgi:hypothetical protein
MTPGMHATLAAAQTTMAGHGIGMDIHHDGYEDGCAQYFGGLVNKRHFVQAYHQDIVTYVVAYEDKFSPPLTRFSCIVRYVEEGNRLKRQALRKGRQ